MSSKRHSILPAIDRSGPRPPVNFSSSLTISNNAMLQGTHSITMQSETVVHPRSKFESNLGSILIGRRCLIHERTHIGARPADIESAKPGGIALGDYVTIEAGSIIEAGGTEIGEGSTIQAGANIGCGSKIGKVDATHEASRVSTDCSRTAPSHNCPSWHQEPSCQTIQWSSPTAQDASISVIFPITRRLL